MMLPNGIGNAMKGYRFATEGVTMRNGDTVMSADDISMVDAAFQTIGLPTSTITDRQRLQTVVAEADKFYEEKAAQIKRDYIRAFNSGDTGGMQGARTAWMEIQESRVRNGYTRQPLSSLLRAPMQQMKRERGVADGVETTRANRQFVAAQI
jgi:hypothetical protein